MNVDRLPLITFKIKDIANWMFHRAVACRGRSTEEGMRERPTALTLLNKGKSG